MDILEEALMKGTKPIDGPTMEPAGRTPARKKPVASNTAKNDFPWLADATGGLPPENIGTPDLSKLEGASYAPTASAADGKGADYADLTKTGLGALAGLFTALGLDDPERSRGNLPGGGGADMPQLSPVDKPFQGRMDMTPDQRQSLALTLLR
jgi:hypothetical protein